MNSGACPGLLKATSARPQVRRISEQVIDELEFIVREIQRAAEPMMPSGTRAVHARFQRVVREAIARADRQARTARRVEAITGEAALVPQCELPTRPTDMDTTDVSAK